LVNNFSNEFRMMMKWLPQMYKVLKMEFKKKMDKKMWLMLLDTVIAYPEYKKLLDSYSEKVDKAVASYNENPDNYYETLNISGKELKENLEGLIQKRLEKFEISLDDITEFFTCATSISQNELEKLFSKKDKTEEENYNYEIPEHHQIGERAYINPGPIGTLQMAYVSAMIHKLNPERIEFTVPEGIVYTGIIGYNLDFDGKVIINGDINDVGRGIFKGNVIVNKWKH